MVDLTTTSAWSSLLTPTIRTPTKKKKGGGVGLARLLSKEFQRDIHI